MHAWLWLGDCGTGSLDAAAENIMTKRIPHILTFGFGLWLGLAFLLPSYMLPDMLRHSYNYVLKCGFTDQSRAYRIFPVWRAHMPLHKDGATQDAFISLPHSRELSLIIKVDTGYYACEKALENFDGIIEMALYDKHDRLLEILTSDPGPKKHIGKDCEIRLCEVPIPYLHQYQARARITVVKGAVAMAPHSATTELVLE